MCKNLDLHLGSTEIAEVMCKNHDLLASISLSTEIAE